jgi:sec-independent protein translocase protein TatB
MLDVGWTEILVIAIVLIIVVGPKDLPQMLRTFGRMMTKMRGMASDFRQQFDEALREADLEDVKKTIGEAQKLNPLNTIREAVNPLRQMGNDIKADLQKSASSVTSSTSTSTPAESVPIAVPSEANKPASSEPVAAVPLKVGPTKKTAAKKPAETAAKPRKAPVKVEAETKAVAKPATKAVSAKKAAPAKSKTTKTKKDEA